MSTIDRKEVEVELVEEQRLVEIDPAEERKLVWKIDLWLMPAIWIIYLLSYVDRSNIGLAKVGGMDDDLNLSANDYYLAVSLFQVGYVIAEVPSNMILAVSRPSLYIPTLMVLWGTVAAAMAAVKTPAQLIGVRVLLGFVEAGFSPAVLFLISTWYKPQEQAKRYITFLSAAIMSGAFGSLVSGAITSRMDGAYGIQGWRWLFIIEGVGTVGAALIAPYFLLDYPASSKRLTQEERDLACLRLQQEGVTNPDYRHSDRHGGHLRALRDALLDWRVWVLSIGYMTVIGSLSLKYFYPTLIKALGYSSTAAQFMTAPLYLVALAVALPTCYFADRLADRKSFFANRAFMTASALFLGALFCALTAGISSEIPRYVLLCFINSAIYTASPLALAFASSCMRGIDPETRAVALALLNAIGNLAQVYGSALFPDEDGPRFIKGFAVYAGCMFLGAGIFSAAFFLIRKWPFKKSQPNVV